MGPFRFILHIVSKSIDTQARAKIASFGEMLFIKIFEQRRFEWLV